jgi:RNA polymerase sigma-70 factor, ECF subfamily
MPDSKLTELAQHAWLETRVALQGYRPELYRFCRALTRSAWDAEDLVQETLLRAFVALGSQYGQSIDNPRAWLFRIASNAWIDRQRRPGELLVDAPPESTQSDPQRTREAVASLLGLLSPHERVAVVLKEAFDLSLEEIADALGTTPGSVKTALHRGRGKLASPAVEVPKTAAPAAIAEFCAAFNAGSLERLTALLLEGAVVELPGVAVDFGLAATTNRTSGILYHSLLEPLSAGVPAAFLTDYVPAPPRAELRSCHDEQLLLIWYRHQQGEAVRCFVRLHVDAESGRIARVREYYYSPEALAELAAELGVPFRSNGYGA